MWWDIPWFFSDWNLCFWQLAQINNLRHSGFYFVAVISVLRDSRGFMRACIFLHEGSIHLTQANWGRLTDASTGNTLQKVTVRKKGKYALQNLKVRIQTAIWLKLRYKKSSFTETCSFWVVSWTISSLTEQRNQQQKCVLLPQLLLLHE